MNFIFDNGGVSIGRDQGDAPIRKESTLVYYILKAFNAEAPSLRRWVRFYPNRHGLTDSRLGVRDRLRGTIYWHANYQVEDAARKWNAGSVYFHKA